MDAEVLLDRSKEHVGRSGYRTWVLDPVDEVVYLAVHAARHHCVRLSWLHDLMLYAEKDPRTLAEVPARAEELGVAPAAIVGLAAAGRYSPGTPALRGFRSWRVPLARLSSHLLGVVDGSSWSPVGFRFCCDRAYRALLEPRLSVGGVGFAGQLAERVRGRLAGVLRDTG